MSVLAERLRRLQAASSAADEAAKDAKAARDAAMGDADAEGWTYKQISEVTGLHVTTVQHAVLRELARRQT